MTVAPPPAVVADDPVADLAVDLPALRRRLHQIPELGYQEVQTAAAVRAWLAERGIEATGEPIAGTGFVVDIHGALPGPTVAYRADMDALPIEEATGAPYASCHPGVMHACGHDAHMTMACGVAVLAHAQRETMHGTLRVLFQPCEEKTPSGAPRMIAAGAVDGVEAIYAVHVDSSLAVGTYGLRAGAISAACLPFRVEIESAQSGHSARPHETADTVWIATQIASALYGLPGRVTDARQTAVLTLCRFEAGHALNVIPARVELGGTLRSIDHGVMEHLKESIVASAEAIGALHGAQVRVQFDALSPAVINSAPEVERIADQAHRLYGADSTVRLPLPSMGGEDFAFYLERLPGALVRVGTWSGERTSHALHDARFDLDESALLPAARLMTEVCRSHLSDASR